MAAISKRNTDGFRFLESNLYALLWVSEWISDGVHQIMHEINSYLWRWLSVEANHLVSCGVRSQVNIASVRVSFSGRLFRSWDQVYAIFKQNVAHGAAIEHLFC